MPAGADKSFNDESICEVWTCNWKTVQLFIALQTQWRMAMGGPTGLDYAAIEVAARLIGIKLTPERFDGIRAMEGEALKVMGEKRGAK